MSSKRSRAAFESDGPPQHAPFALYGTPLPAFDPEVRDDGSYVPMWKQEVTDERGRKRLHGAFTGGFSAGYYNTVGSKEGWAPASFVSSRSNRATKSKVKDGASQRVEDFMDEEDLAERSEAQQIGTQGDFAGLGGSDGNGAGKGMFADLFRSTGETIGVKLLKQMGWREGQGVGPKVRRRAEGDKTGEQHLFAPENTDMVKLVKKTDRKGLGFAVDSSLADFTGKAAASDDEENDADARILSANRSKLLAKPRVKLKKSAIGMGVLNDTGSDDEDPYAIGPQINYSRVIGGDKKKRKGGLVTASTVQKPPAASKKAIQSSTPSLQGFRRCHDGRLPLDGFVLSMQRLEVTESKYPPPVVPLDWKSRRATKFDTSATTFTSTADVAKSSTLNPSSRAALLGEATLPGKSVFDFLSTSARDRLVSASGKTNLPQAKGEHGPVDASSAPAQKSLWDLVPPLDVDTASAALARGKTGWLPYAEDPPKRDRYTAFLSLRAGQQDPPILPARSPGVTTEAWAQELREFAQAAEVFKPISGLMATRFAASTSAPALASDAPDPTPAPTKVLSAAEEAAKAGMYGPLTRKTYAFYPTRLLCKRFNVPAPTVVDPSTADAAEERKSMKDLVNVREMERMMGAASASAGSGVKMKSFASAGTEEGDGGESVNKPVAADAEATDGHARVDVEVNEALEGMRPEREVYKSIFGDEG
ncbi:hypothetical protein B0A48_02776 [Cryoendolithus antarcticus]|uniref:G-patch domain-containing protein n=1 Tax=Cryoendolithus antarcticus TaxID=1507870 RepID=A0A1V8TL98_9PEZI|nr:hypothetical protein B0A48_02776 [Cryoendolithus antarcticus]